MKFREYLKLARSFNAVLTGVSPVLGAIAMGHFNLLELFLLFLVGFLGHSFGFIFNDIIDFKIDKTSKEISDRPLLSGTITIKKAWIFAIITIILAFLIALIICYIHQNYFPLIILLISAFFIILYDLTSKKICGMDIFVSLGVFFLILYGASTTVNSLNQISKLAWIVCILGSIQVLYMQLIAGGLKDIENDYNRGVKSIAIKLGVRITNGSLKISSKFKVLAYGIQLIDLIVVFLPFFIIWNINELTILQYLQWIIIVLIGIIMFYLSYKLMSMSQFDRMKARKLIGSHYMINFMIVPVMLMCLNPWTGILVFFPGLGFILSNIILHGTLLQPKTM
ncbi:MAG: UbiA family prenyltransferase [Candidatus Thermoplasmatota archaeon]|jgi:4-hydroxybenzoate polyprenyltransferase|nr:UbiA family prenyltransferase [Candidatus Thermoplasmatota archaeon]